MREEHVRRTVPSLAYLTDQGEPFAFVLSPKCCWLASFGSSLKGQGREGECRAGALPVHKAKRRLIMKRRRNTTEIVANIRMGTGTHV